MRYTLRVFRTLPRTASLEPLGYDMLNDDNPSTFWVKASPAIERFEGLLGDFFNAVFGRIEGLLTRFIGSANRRRIETMNPAVEEISALEPEYQAMSDEELRRQSEIFRGLLNGLIPLDDSPVVETGSSLTALRSRVRDRIRKRVRIGKVASVTLDDLLPDAFAACREAGRRVLEMRHYDVQLMGGIVLHTGDIAEMITGEGKTLVATLPAYLNALDEKGVHVVTVNDYLARRDMEWMSPLYTSLGLTVGAIWSGMEPADRQKAYGCDITYGTNNEFGFDYLRDNMRQARKGDLRYSARMQQAQRLPLNFAIIDEVDNILIDEARTPLIISGPAHGGTSRYALVDKLTRQLQEGVHFEVNRKDRSTLFTDDGVRFTEELVNKTLRDIGEKGSLESFYSAGQTKWPTGRLLDGKRKEYYAIRNVDWPHLIDNSLKAHFLYNNGVNYIVKDGEVVIVDEFTGRLMPGRNWSDGLHQAVEAKERVKIKEENQTLATITLQNFFKLYGKLSGMTGTAMTEVNEFIKNYDLDVVTLPTNRPLKRDNFSDLVYRTEKEKEDAVVDEIERMNKWDVLSLASSREEIWCRLQKETDDKITFKRKGLNKPETIDRSDVEEIQYRGRPILVGTISIEKSEHIGALLAKRGIEHQVLNAKHHESEAEIIAQAGRKSRVTIATNMAGRGTDIILGGNAEALAWVKLRDKHGYQSRLEVSPEEWGLVQEIEEEFSMKAEGDEIRKMGGLHVIGTERHEARRIDRQLQGRCGRQGDPGSSRFFLSLEDDLMKIFGGEWVGRLMGSLGMEEGQAIESKIVSRRVEGAQKKREEYNSDIRKNLLEYDEVMDEQRKRAYGYRQRILNGCECKQLLFDMFDKEIAVNLGNYLDKDYCPTEFAVFANRRLGMGAEGGVSQTKLRPRDFRHSSFDQAEEYSKDYAKRKVEGQIYELIEENLPEEEEPNVWKWEGLTTLFNSNYVENEQGGKRNKEIEPFLAANLKKMERDEVAALLIETAKQSIESTDLSDGRKLLELNYGRHKACEWVQDKFGIELDFDEIAELEIEDIQTLVLGRVDAEFEEKQVRFPVEGAKQHFSRRDPKTGLIHFDRPGVADWAQHRFDAELDLEELKSKQRREIEEILIECSRKNTTVAEEKLREAREHLDEMFTAQAPEDEKNVVEQYAKIKHESTETFLRWMNEEYLNVMTLKDATSFPKEKLERQVAAIVEMRYRREYPKYRTNPETTQQLNNDIHEAIRFLNDAFVAQSDNDADPPTDAKLDPEHEETQVFCDWLNENYSNAMTDLSLVDVPREDLESRVDANVEARYRPEMQRQIRTLILQNLDTSWRDHLLAMDQLRSALGLVGYAQRDTKVEYKREGMQYFEKMWAELNSNVTQLIFKLKDSEEESEVEAAPQMTETHDSPDEILSQQESAIEGTQKSDNKKEPFRRQNEKTRRNDPCPCGSGKKYKRCCGQE
jgi:preprotein translocase subunit SecA